MSWQDLFALLLGIVFLVLVGKSLVGSWLLKGDTEPLQGKYVEAQQWLEANGYRVIHAREQAEWVGYYDDRAFRKSMIADFIVRQGAKYYVVKVMNAREQGVSGQTLRDHWYPLYVIFGVHGVLHIDVDEEQVHVVDFEVKQPRFMYWRRAMNRIMWFVSGFIIAFVWIHRG